MPPATAPLARADRRPRRRLRAGARPAHSPSTSPTAAQAAPAPSAVNDGVFLAMAGRTELKCQAPHPAIKKGRHLGEKHNTTLLVAPFNAEPTGRLLTSEEDADRENGCFALRCTAGDCVDPEGHRMFTEFRAIPPGQVPGEALAPLPADLVPPLTL